MDPSAICTDYTFALRQLYIQQYTDVKIRVQLRKKMGYIDPGPVSRGTTRWSMLGSTSIASYTKAESSI